MNSRLKKKRKELVKKINKGNSHLKKKNSHKNKGV